MSWLYVLECHYRFRDYDFNFVSKCWRNQSKYSVFKYKTEACFWLYFEMEGRKLNQTQGNENIKYINITFW